MVLAAEQAAPGWVPVVALAVPILIMLAVLVPALRRRGRAKSARRSLLGLKSRMPAAGNLLKPHVFWGSRAAGQVFIRLGPPALPLTASPTSSCTTCGCSSAWRTT
jgi:hypothetical protein